MHAPGTRRALTRPRHLPNFTHVGVEICSKENRHLSLPLFSWRWPALLPGRALPWLLHPSVLLMTTPCLRTCPGAFCTMTRIMRPTNCTNGDRLLEMLKTAATARYG
jgi:hypothetical protein